MNQVGQDSFLKCCPDIQSCTFLKDGVQIASGTYPHLGPYYVTPGYVFISGIKEERLFLQIMILMIKDTMKLLDRTVGQGNIGYDGITFANHSDYHKRNNAQRGIANNPVFKVKGQFVGMLLLFVRTHEFLERSVIYYNDRADLIGFKDGQFVNLSPRLMVWEGQLGGGFEGLRQKGWSIVNRSVIEREIYDEENLIMEIKNVANYNSAIVKAIVEGDRMFQNVETPADLERMIVKLLFLDPSLSGINGMNLNSGSCTIWDFSATRSDELRLESLGGAVYGMTIPIPSELLGKITEGTSNCAECRGNKYHCQYLSDQPPVKAQLCSTRGKRK
ncbi:unnamed protein product [Enterobius vermicularis]|uniref:RdRp catalytic domain-containing protein n=1 Tax=Enterobius vermicularis TaxID=51028 RepID=A0A0N4V384_ENTVE|nr:unnamed protein product [Enterobius vermicularis]